MPMAWVPPEVAFMVDGVRVYHTYKNNDLETPLSYWFSLDPEETSDNSDDSEMVFDIRSLPVDDLPEGVIPYSEAGHILLVRAAIKAGRLVPPLQPEQQQFYRTELTCVLLSDEPLREDMTLEEAHYMMTEGHCSGQVIQCSSKEITPQEMVRALLEQQSDPEFLNLETVTCALCGKLAYAGTAHRHQERHIGECCWDDRLKSSE